MIIKEADVVITHFGIQGLRWGVRKDRYEQNRQKASNIVSKNKDSKAMNKQDLTAAEWMSKPVSDKIASEIFKNTINVAALLDKKTSELHTIYDGYLSVLEKISSKRG